ncbi:MAG: sugar phosphate isomerase/epimerase [Phycisphaerae bacterium]|nr:sugar phosphate isomerase/epimerase [Phycisphaerae bacterium]
MSGESTRRELLRWSMAIGTASTLVSISARGANPQSAIHNPQSPKPLKLGLMSYTLAKDWDIDTIIKNCKETGFEHVELRTTHAHGVEVTMNKEQRQAVRRRFEDAGLKISLSSGFAYHYPDPAQLRKEIEGTKEYTILAQDVGAIGIRVFPNALPGGKGIPEEQTLRQIGKSLAEVGSFAHDHGVDIRLEIHGSGTNIVAKVKAMVDYSQSPYVYVNWNCDPNDVKGLGFDANFDSVKDRIRNVHMHELWEDYPYRRLFERLRQMGYTGYCDAEIDASKEPIRLMKYYRATFLALQNAI